MTGCCARPKTNFKTLLLIKKCPSIQGWQLFRQSTLKKLMPPNSDALSIFRRTNFFDYNRFEPP